MFLVITGSRDGTVSQLIENGLSPVFRLNFDLYQDYSLAFTPSGWSITDPSGRKITSETVTICFWWKAFSYKPATTDKLLLSEIKYTFKELYSWCKIRNLCKGNAPWWHNECGKINILKIASKYFSVPSTIVTWDHCGIKDANFSSNLVVAKTLDTVLSSEGKAIFAQTVDIKKTDPRHQWFFQEEVKGKWDITVYFIGKRCFAFKRDRSNLCGLDWRAEQDLTDENEEWIPFNLTNRDNTSLIHLSEDLKIESGRYDFMLDEAKDELVFLEYNANGQWLFLDYRKKHGLLDATIDWLNYSTLPPGINELPDRKRKPAQLGSQ